MKPILGLIAAATLTALAASDASAQLNNRPYNFPGSGGPGMSVAGKQAIIMNEVSPGFDPSFLLRSPTGGLLTVAENPEGSAVPLVFAPDGTLIPSFRRGFRASSGVPVFGAGVFNPFFAGGSGNGYVGRYPGFGGDAITVWTARVSGSGAFGATGDSISDWTAAAHFLGPAN